MPPADDSLPLLEFPDAEAFAGWLQGNHDTSPGIWCKLAKKSAPRRTITQPQAIETALCFGWIDGQVGRVDEHFYRQRFTKRRRQSKWSQINREKAGQLIVEKRMQPPGQQAIDEAKADGRWDAAYPPASQAQIPPDLQAALDANPRAADFFATLTGANRYAVLFRIHDAKRPETRARRIQKYVEMLARRETLH